MLWAGERMAGVDATPMECRSYFSIFSSCCLSSSCIMRSISHSPSPLNSCRAAASLPWWISSSLASIFWMTSCSRSQSPTASCSRYRPTSIFSSHISSYSLSRSVLARPWCSSAKIQNLKGQILTFSDPIDPMWAYELAASSRWLTHLLGGGFTCLQGSAAAGGTGGSGRAMECEEGPSSCWAICSVGLFTEVLLFLGGWQNDFFLSSAAPPALVTSANTISIVLLSDLDFRFTSCLPQHSLVMKISLALKEGSLAGLMFSLGWAGGAWEEEVRTEGARAGEGVGDGVGGLVMGMTLVEFSQPMGQEYSILWKFDGN